MLKNIFIRKSDNKLRFIWRFGLILGIGQIVGKWLGVAILYFIALFFAFVKGTVIPADSPMMFGLSLLIEKIIMLALVTFFIYKVDKKSLKHLGISLNKYLHSIKEFFVGSLIGAISMTLIVLIFIILKLIKVENIELTDINNPPFLAFLVYTTVLFLLVAFQEELMCRAYMICDLSGQKSIIAIAIPAVIFALLHIGNPQFSFDTQRKTLITLIAIFNILLIGLVLGAYFLLTKNFWLIVGIHFSWNFVQGSILGFNVSGLESKEGLMNLHLSSRLSDYLFTGGRIGPEGGIVVSIGLLSIPLMLIAYSLLKKLLNKSVASNYESV